MSESISIETVFKKQLTELFIKLIGEQAYSDVLSGHVGTDELAAKAEARAKRAVDRVNSGLGGGLQLFESLIKEHDLVYIGPTYFDYVGEEGHLVNGKPMLVPYWQNDEFIGFVDHDTSRDEPGDPFFVNREDYLAADKPVDVDAFDLCEFSYGDNVLFRNKRYAIADFLSGPNGVVFEYVLIDRSGNVCTAYPQQLKRFPLPKLLYR